MSTSVEEVIRTVINRKKLKNMYDKLICEREPASEDVGVNLLYASFLAEGRRLRESLQILCNIIKNYSHQLNVEKLFPVISKIVDSLRQETKEKDFILTRDPLSCSACCGVLYQPCSLPCGHTYCKPCLQRDLGKCSACQVKGSTTTTNSMEESVVPQTNVLISSLVQKWWTSDIEGAVLRAKANKFFKDRQYDSALEVYTEAINNAPNDHLLLSNRSHTYHAVGRPEAALEDANEAVRHCPQWAKGHFRQAQALAAHGREEDALVALLVCATLVGVGDLPEGVVNEIARTLLTVGRRGLWMGEESRRQGEVTRSAVRKRQRSESGPEGAHELHSPAGAMFVSRVLQKFSARLEFIKACVGDYGRTVNPDLVQKSDFECSLCYHCLWEPVTTPCGHTFCRSCLDRCLDHAIHCPLCKTSLKDYLAENRSNVTEFVEEALKRYLPTEYQERGRQHEQEMAEFAKAGKDLQHEIPIFVATLAFPSVACPLHVFEPRYRLMIRRVMEAGTREFGMCRPADSDQDGFSNYGTVLEVREVRPLSDGRRIVNAVGSRRFRCVSKGVRDGYDTASVEYLKDSHVKEGVHLEELRQLHDSVHLCAREWFNSIDEGTKRRILGHYGPMPLVEGEYWTLPDGPVWVWWLIAILPLDPSIQMCLMRKCNLHARLSLVMQILRCVQQQQNPPAGGSNPRR